MAQDLHYDIKSNFGSDCVRVVRNYENISRKLADHRNHLRFNLRCLHTKITPNSLKLRTTVNGYKANVILKSAEKKLLNERIRQTNYKINLLIQERNHIETNLRDLLTPDRFKQVQEFTTRVQLQQHEISKRRQIKKYELLTKRVSQADSDNNWRRNDNITSDTTDKWIKNLSDRALNNHEQSVLSKGLNFAIPPKSLPVVDIITATESAIKKANLQPLEAETLRHKISTSLSHSSVPTSNISKEEEAAIKSLKNDKNIVILPADKGWCTVVLNHADYDKKVQLLLSDTDTYELLRRDPTAVYKRKIVQVLLDLERSGIISHDLKRRLYPTAETVPTFYGLPKIHKPEVPLRPIISSIDSITYNIAKYVSSLLSPLVGLSEHHIVNSQDFAEKIKGVKIEEDESLISYDVKSLFTCIPPDEAVSVVRDKLVCDPSFNQRTSLSISNICELLSLCLNTTYFVYGGKYYKQKHGCAMGSPCSPIIANLYMEYFETNALTTYTGQKPSMWLRYVDDTFVIIKSQELDSFFVHINGCDPFIKFTQEKEQDHSIPFLDCRVSRSESGSLHTTVYRKPTHTDQYLAFDSHHPLTHKQGVVRTLHHRADTIVSDPDNTQREKDHLNIALGKCGYPKWAINSALFPRHRATDSDNRPKATATIPYVSGLSEQLQRKFGEHNIRVAHKPVNTLRQMLVHPKDKQEKDRVSGVVYHINCEGEGCQEQYIGETEQPLKKRMYQHKHTSVGSVPSAVYTHLSEHDHAFNNENVQILSRENRWFERGVKEAIFVHAQDPSLNKQGGTRFTLSSAWNDVIRNSREINVTSRSFPATPSSL